MMISGRIMVLIIFTVFESYFEFDPFIYYINEGFSKKRNPQKH